MQYAVIALDLDGTLTNAKKEITPKTKKALIDIQQKGVRLVLSSGRPPFGIYPLAQELKLADYGGYIIAYNGGLVIDCESNTVLFNLALSHEQVQLLTDYAKSAGMTIMAYFPEHIITEQPENQYVAHASFINKMPIKGVDNFVQAATLPLNKCLIVGDPEPLHSLESIMQQELEGKLNIFRSMPFFMETVPLGVDKAKALELILSKLQLNAEALIACGDGWNDISMLEFAGLGVAMANAHEDVKSKADYITKFSNEEDGIAEVVDKFF